MQMRAKAPRDAWSGRSAEAILHGAQRSPAITQVFSPAKSRSRQSAGALSDLARGGGGGPTLHDHFASSTSSLGAVASHGLAPGRCLGRAARKSQSGLQLKPERLLPPGYERPPPELAELAHAEARRQARRVLRTSYRQALENVAPGAFDRQEPWPPKELGTTLVPRGPARCEPQSGRKQWQAAERENQKRRKQTYMAQTAPLPAPVQWFQASSSTTSLPSPSARSSSQLPRLASASALSSTQSTALPEAAQPDEDADRVQAYLAWYKEQNRRRRQEGLEQLRRLGRGCNGGPYTLGQLFVEVEANARHVPAPDCRPLGGALGPEVLGKGTTRGRRRLPFPLS